MSKVTIVVDAERCVGSGTCMAIAPHLFRFDDEDRAQTPGIPVVEDDDVRTAVDMCPTSAIALLQVVDDDLSAGGSSR